MRNISVMHGFSGDNGFVLVHAIISYTLLILAIILNLLVFVLVKGSKKIDSFRYVFYTYCAMNVIFGSCFSITLMQWIQAPGIIIFFPTGPFAHNNTIMHVVLKVQVFIYFFVMCLVCATFVYRYFKVTQLNANVIKVRALTALSFVPSVLWLVDSMLTDEPDLRLRKRINDQFGTRFAVNFEQIYIFAMETDTNDLDPQKVFSAFFTIIQLVVIIWTGRRIYQTIHKSAGCKKSKAMERKAFRLLLCQVINPIIMLQLPSFVNCFQTEMLKLPDLVNHMSCIIMNSFTVTNPLLNIMLSSDLSNSLKSRLMRAKTSTASITPH